MPLQHADDSILRAMRRERSGAALVSCSNEFARGIPGVVLRDLVHRRFLPGETDAAFERLQDFVRSEKFDRVGVFYLLARRENTGAYAMADQVPERVKRARRSQLMTTRRKFRSARIAL